jgi:hypothetical protein
MAADAVLFIGWNRVVPGKETEAVALFQEALAYYGQQQQAGTIAGFDPVFLAPHGGDLNGFILVRGDEAKLNQMRMTDDYITLETRASNLLEGHGVIMGWRGEEINRRMAIYQRVTSS